MVFHQRRVDRTLLTQGPIIVEKYLNLLGLDAHLKRFLVAVHRKYWRFWDVGIVLRWGARLHGRVVLCKIQMRHSLFLGFTPFSGLDRANALTDKQRTISNLVRTLFVQYNWIAIGTKMKTNPKYNVVPARIYLRIAKRDLRPDSTCTLYNTVVEQKKLLE